MPVSVKTLYDSIPYDVLADPELGPLSSTAIRKDVDVRYARVAKRGLTPERRAAWDALINPGKRASWDIFCSAADRSQDAVRKLVDEVPTFKRGEPSQPALDIIPDLIDWETVPVSTVLAEHTPREISLGLSGLYDDLEIALCRIDFDV
jgi:hypothetical protein